MTDEQDPEATGESERESLPPQGPGSRRRRAVFFAIWGVILVGAVLLFRAVLLPFVLAVVVAYVLAPLVILLQRVRIGTREQPRWVAVVELYAVLIGLLSLFAAIGVPRLVAEVERLARDAPQAVRTVRDDWLPALEERLREAMEPYQKASPGEATDAARGAAAARRPTTGTGGGMDAGVPSAAETAIRVVPGGDGSFEVRLPREGIVVNPEGDGYRVGGAPKPRQHGRDLTSAITEALARVTENTEKHAVTLLKTAQTVGRAVVRGVFDFVLMLMLSAYMLITSDRILGFLRSLVRPRRRMRFDDLLGRIDRGLSGVVRGQLLICLVNGVLSGIGFYVFDLDYWPILTIFATVLSIIPIFGAIISSIPAVLVALQQGMGTAVLVLLWIVGIHQIEANLLNPKIMGDSAKVHPVLVIFALLAGEHLYGIAGALLAVPVLSVVQSLFLHFREVSLGPREG